MPMPTKPPSPEQAKQGAFEYLRKWGENPLPPSILATLVAAQHLRPFQALPMLFPPVLLFSSYLNLQGYAKDAAGLTSAWSMAYFVLARRRRQALRAKFGARGLVRGATLGLCVANAVAGGWTYWAGGRGEEGSGGLG